MVAVERISAAAARVLIAEAGERKRHKYGAKPITVHGKRFASTLEGNRYAVLHMLERAGTIHSLKCQPRFPLVVEGEKMTTYVADFSYYEPKRHGARLVVEDAKGAKLRLYLLKRSLFRQLYPEHVFMEITR